MEAEAEYLDASILLRALYRLPGASPLHDSGRVFTSSEIVSIEVALSIDRRRHAGAIDEVAARRFHADWKRLRDSLHLFPLSDEVIAHSLESFPSPVSLSTAIHVSTAQVVQREVSRLRFWTASEPDAAAAAARQLQVAGTAPGA